MNLLNDKIIDEVSVFAGVLVKLHKKRIITNNKYIRICKIISNLMYAKSEKEADALYNDLKECYAESAWVHLYLLHCGNDSKCRSTRNQHRYSCLSIVSY